MFGLQQHKYLPIIDHLILKKFDRCYIVSKCKLLVVSVTIFCCLFTQLYV